VVDGASGAPIAFAAVVLSDAPPISVETDSGGRFAMELPLGVKVVRPRAIKDGYLPGQYGTLAPHDVLGGSRSLEIHPGQSVEGVRIRLWREGRVVGRVTDEGGTAAIGASVALLSRTYTGAGYRWTIARGFALVDDRGEYVVDRLAPGRYVVAVRPAATRGKAVATVPVTFFPGTRSLSASAILEVDGAEIRADIVVDRILDAGGVSGKLIGQEPGTQSVVVRLIPIDLLGVQLMPFARTSEATADGEFRFDDVVPGRYALSVCHFPPTDEGLFSYGGDFNRTVEGFSGPRPKAFPILTPAPATPTWVAYVPVEIGPAERRTIDVPLRPGARISGRVVFSGSAPPPTGDLLTVPVVIQPADGVSPLDSTGRPAPLPQTRLEHDGTFRSPGLPPGDYVLNVLPGARALAGWNTTSIAVGAREVLGDSITIGATDVNDVVITLGEKPAVLMGSVERRDEAVSETRVIVFPSAVADRDQFLARPAPQRVRQIAVLPDGTFSTPLPPGSYLVAAVKSFPVFWMEPEFLEKLAGRATHVTLRPGRTEQVSVAVQ
jgi:hypothetical protein